MDPRQSSMTSDNAIRSDRPSSLTDQRSLSLV